MLDSTLGELAGFVVSQFLLFYMAHFLIWRFISVGKKGVFLISFIALLTFTILSFLGIWHGWLGSSADLWLAGPGFFLLVMLYLHFYTAIDRSVSLRLLGELVRRHPPQLNFSELQQVYASEEMVASRLQLLVQKGFLTQEGSQGFYYCSAKGRILARITFCLQALYGIKEAG